MTTALPNSFLWLNSMNKLTTLPRGFGAFPVLEVLDLTYNNLNESSLPGNFFMLGKLFFVCIKLKAAFGLYSIINLETLRALYLGDNDFEKVPSGIGNLKNLQIVRVTLEFFFKLTKSPDQIARSS